MVNSSDIILNGMDMKYAHVTAVFDNQPEALTLVNTVACDKIKLSTEEEHLRIAEILSFTLCINHHRLTLMPHSTLEELALYCVSGILNPTLECLLGYHINSCVLLIVLNVVLTVTTR